MRTDEDLRRRLADDLLRWGERLDASTLASWEAVSGDDAEAVMLMNMTRSFLRGLLIQEQYGVSREQTLKYVNKWIDMVEPQLRLKNQPVNGNRHDE